MGLSILYNISALEAENELSVTNTAANKSLQELSSGSRINSGSDDAAGLAISNGLNANIAALNQSSLNATNATGALQTADGALAQITGLLNRAVTLASEASSSDLSTSQHTAINTEYGALLIEVNNIASGTNFNGTAIFSTNADPSSSVVSAYTSDGTTNGTVSITVTVAAVDTTTLGLTLPVVSGTSLTGGLDTSSNASDALRALDTAINQISQDRGTLGATVEQLQAASTVDTSEAQNLTSASSSITSADISTVVANDTKFSILEQTGISALQQANQQAQTVLKLLQ